MVINIELPDETVAALIEQAQTQRRPAADLASLRHGFDDLEAGRTLSLADAHAEFSAAFLARFGEGGG